MQLPIIICFIRTKNTIRNDAYLPNASKCKSTVKLSGFFTNSEFSSIAMTVSVSAWTTPPQAKYRRIALHIKVFKTISDAFLEILFQYVNKKYSIDSE